LVGTQFPPWTEGTDVWGVQHLMHPALQEPVFAEWYGSSDVQQAVCQLLGIKPEELQLGKNIRSQLNVNTQFFFFYDRTIQLADQSSRV
jgi:hypothetical protein